MTKLSVNINKLATLRNSRGKNNPDLLKTTLDIIDYGAQGITVHPRPDARHIRHQDVYDLAQAISVEFNIEGYPDQSFLQLVTTVKPTQCTLVPDAPTALTSNAGWAIKENYQTLKTIVSQLHDHGIRTALFVDPYHLSAEEIELLSHIATDRVELYTECFADHFASDRCAEVIAVYQRQAQAIKSQGIALNAGHDLNLANLAYFVQAIPSIEEVSIGHALICDALYYGLKDTMARYLACLL
jgi:pyridoxine 5-phosphate synthase